MVDEKGRMTKKKKKRRTRRRRREIFFGGLPADCFLKYKRKEKKKKAVGQDFEMKETKRHTHR